MNDLLEKLRKFGGPGRGTWAPHNLACRDAADRIKELEAENARLREALTPSGETKVAYSAEVGCHCWNGIWPHDVPWTSIKEIMKMIRARAALKEKNDDKG